MAQNEQKKQYKFFQTPKILKKLDPYEWVLFTVLFDEWNMMKNEEEWFFRSEYDLSEDTGLSSATIYRKIKSLEEKGLILLKRHSNGKTKSERYKSNEYKINMEKVISLAPIKTNQKDEQSHQKDEPSNNPISNNNNIYKHNIPEHKVTGVKENKKEINKEKIKEKLSGQSSMDDKVSGQDNKIFKKENVMSDNGTNVMNAISEQSERQAKENKSSGCDKINEMITSKSGDQNKIEDKVTSPKVSPSSNNNDPIDANVTGDKDMYSSFKNEDKVSGISDQNAHGPKNTDDNKAIPSKDDMAIEPDNSDVNANKAAGDLKNPSMDKLSNPIEKMEPDAPESPKTEFKRTSNDGNGGHKVQSGKVNDDCSIFDENCPKPYPPQIPPIPPFPLNKAAGDLKNPSMEQLPTNEIKSRHNSPESPQIEFDEKWYNETYALMDNFKTNEDLDELYTRFKQSNNKRMINDFKCKVWKRYDLDNGLQNKLTEMFREFRRMIA